MGLEFEDETRKMRKEAIQSAISMKEKAALVTMDLNSLRSLDEEDEIPEPKLAPGQAPPGGLPGEMPGMPPPGGGMPGMPPPSGGLPGLDMGAPPAGGPPPGGPPGEAPPMPPPV